MLFEIYIFNFFYIYIGINVKSITWILHMLHISSSFFFLLLNMLKIEFHNLVLYFGPIFKKYPSLKPKYFWALNEPSIMWIEHKAPKGRPRMNMNERENEKGLSFFITEFFIFYLSIFV